MYSKEELLEKIEMLREVLTAKVGDFDSGCSAGMLKLSEQLDKLIVEYLKKTM